MSQSISLSKLSLHVLTSNHISKEVQPGWDFLAKNFYAEAVESTPKPINLAMWNSMNFEFVPGIVGLPNGEVIKQMNKIVEVREIRGRGALKKTALTNPIGNLKLGVFCCENLDPGVLIVEYFGHVQIPQLLTKKGNFEKITQSHVLFVPRMKPVICLDARRSGNIARHIRRSCRPNCSIKIVLTGDQSSDDVHIGIFSKNSILDGEELFLPIDYQDGNTMFRYECACGNAELCLAPEAAQPAPKPRSSSTPSFEMVDTLKPQQRAKTPQQSSSLLSGQAAAKLSREERKLMQYIEQIDRMGHAEKKSASRKSSSGITSSVSALNMGSTSPSSRNSPKRDSSPISSSPRYPHNSSMVIEEANEGDEEEEMSTVVEEMKEKKPVGRPPKSPSKKATKEAKTKTPKPKMAEEVRPKKLLSESEFDTRSPKDEESKVLNIDDDIVNVTDDSSEPKVDIFLKNIDSPTFGNRSNNSSPFQSNSSEPTPDISTSQPETPSKKRVSLSDYMKKRRATESTISGREEGELPQPKPISTSYDTRKVDPYSYGAGQERPSNYNLPPPHLTPPPPIYHQSPSMPSTEYGRSKYSSTDRPYDNRRLEIDEPVGAAAKYGYISKNPSSSRYHPLSNPSNSLESGEYRPRPSLIKAAQDLPTRWEEAAASGRTHESIPPSRDADYHRRDYMGKSGYGNDYTSSPSPPPPPGYPPRAPFHPPKPQYDHPGWRRPGSGGPHPPPPGPNNSSGGGSSSSSYHQQRRR